MKKKYITIGILLIVLISVDLITKSTFVNADYKVIPYIINFSYTENSGAGWSILSGQTGWLIAISSVLSVLIIIYFIFSKKNHVLHTIAIGLLLAGALGNLIDRIAFGYVRDFIQFAFWTSFPVFNFADICLTIGVTLLIIYILFVDKTQNSKEKEDKK